MSSPEYLAFLEKRIPELQSEGKPFPHEGPHFIDKSTGKTMVAIAQNLEGSKYPGVRARRQADREWAENASARS